MNPYFQQPQYGGMAPPEQYGGYHQQQHQQQPQYKCPGGHPLQGTIMSTAWKCDNCNNHQNPGFKSFGCRMCNFDSCEPCLMNQQHQHNATTATTRYPGSPTGSQTTVTSHLHQDASKCPAGHPLKKSFFGTAQRWKCDRCNQVRVGGASYGCRADNFDQCEVCYNSGTSSQSTTSASSPVGTATMMQQQAPSSSSTIDDPTTCDEGHDLLRAPMPDNQRWQCDFCDSIQRGGQSWGDRKCNIDMCDECYQRQTEKQKHKKQQKLQQQQQQQAALLAQQQQASAPTTTATTIPTPTPTPAVSVPADMKVPCWLCRQPLTRQDLPSIDWKCDKCLKMFRGGASFGCRSCDRDACSGCYHELEQKRMSALGKLEHKQQVQQQLHPSPQNSAQEHKQEEDDLKNQQKIHNEIDQLIAQAMAGVASNFANLGGSGHHNYHTTTSTTSSSSSSSSAKCPSGHPLTKSILNNITWKCDKCMKMNNGGAAYSCRQDNFDICEACALGSSSSSYTSSSSTTTTTTTSYHYSSSSTTTNKPSSYHTGMNLPSHNNNTPSAPLVTKKYSGGRCKAVLIGINYPGTKAELKGCVNDVALMKKVLPVFGFELNSSNCKILVDDRSFPGRTGAPTKQEIMNAMEWLARDARPGDNLWMSYSGHGCRVEDDDGDEDDGYDEALVPADYQTSGLIRDDWIFDHLVKPLPAGCQLRILADACHSGSVCELEHKWVFAGEEKKFIPYKSTHRHRGFVTATSKRAQCDAWQLSGSMDTQTSSDISSTVDFDVDLLVGSGPGKAGGACTTSLVEVLARAPRGPDGSPNLSHAELFYQLQYSLRRRRFTQRPQFSMTKKFDFMNAPFSLVGPIDPASAPTISSAPQQQTPSSIAAPLYKRKPKFKALFIGINYPGTKAELKGCQNDVLTWMKMMETFGFDISDRRVLADNRNFPGRTGEPTKQEIQDAMKWLAEGATADTHLMFMCACHGTRLKDDDGDEDDGYDEALVPCDYTRAGCIRDDWIFDNMIKPLPSGCNLFAVTDCCHSGSILDLQYIWKWDGEERRFAPQKPHRSRALHQNTSKHANATVIAFSGCQDHQTSSDVSSTIDFHHNFGKKGPGMSGGAMTNAMAEALSDAPKRSSDARPDISYMELLFRCQENLKRRRFTQVPQMTTSQKVDLNQKFDMVAPFK